MEIFETVLAGTDGLIDGLVSSAVEPNVGVEYTFSALDGSLTLVIVKDDGHWKRVNGTEPYLSGWVEELGEQIDMRRSSGTSSAVL